MRFVWDERKSRQNLAKHKVGFELATLVFDDPHHPSQPDPHEGEDRWRTLGVINGIVILLVVHATEEKHGEITIRIISARKATRREREAYQAAQ
jgi:uncharacterized protein